MTSSWRRDSAPALRVPAWTGWIMANVYPYDQGSDAGVGVPTVGPAGLTMEISVRVDAVILWLGWRNLAVIDRDRIRAWTTDPFQPMAVDQVEFVLVDGQLCLRIDETGPYALSVEAVRRLLEVL